VAESLLSFSNPLTTAGTSSFFPIPAHQPAAGSCGAEVGRGSARPDADVVEGRRGVHRACHRGWAVQCCTRRCNVFRAVSLGIAFRTAPHERCTATPCAARPLTVFLRHATTRAALRPLPKPPPTTFAFWSQVLGHGSRGSPARASFSGNFRSPRALARFFFACGGLRVCSHSASWLLLW